MSVYDYRYEEPAPDASDEVKAAVARRNAASSLMMDPLRVGMGLSATQLRARILAAKSETNGRG